MKKQIVGLAIFGLLISVFFQNCSRPVSFQESAPLDLASLSVSGLLINNGAEFTNNSIVSLSLDVGNAADMYITNSPDCSSGGAWVPATEQLSWELNSLNGESAVYAKFRSIYQKESPCMSDSIVHDNIAPVIALQSALAPATNQLSTSFGLVTTDAGSGIEKVFCPASIASCSNSISSANTADGVKSFSFYATDRAGNKSADLNVSYLVDRTPPSLRIAQQPPARTGSQTASFLFSGSDTYSRVVTYKCQMSGGAYVSCPFNYSIPGLGEGDYSMNVVAVDELGNTSAPQNAAWSVSRKLPVVTITKAPPLFTNQKGSFEFSGTDQFGAQLTLFQCQLNADIWKACTSPFDLSALNLNQGVNSFRVRGTDKEAIVSGEELRQWNYDTSIPVIKFDPKPAAFTNKVNENALVSVANSEAVEIEFKLDGAAVTTTVPGNYSFSPAEGAHSISAVATDKAGNKSATITSSFVSDFTKPTLSFSNSFPVLPTPTASNALNFQVVAADSNMAAGNALSTFYSLADLAGAASSTDNFILFVSPVNLTSIKHGSHQVKFYVKDAAGNVSDYYVSNPFLVDLISPAISYLDQPPANTRPNTNLYINYLVQDTDSGLASTKCKLTVTTLSGSTVVFDQPCAVAFNYLYTSDIEGTFVFNITAVDNVGRISERSVSWASAEEFQAQSKTFTVAAQNNNKVDILFVRDNSHSMQDEQASMAGAFSNFINNLGGLDYRIAVTTTDTALGGGLQEVGPKNSGITYVDRSSPNALAGLQAGLTMHTNQSGDETGLTTIMGFIGRAKTAGSTENAFYRPDAVLATVVLSDSDEKAKGGYQSADLFLAALSAALPSKVYINHSSIILPGDEACLTQDNDDGQEYGVTYADVSNITGGNSVSICSSNYGNELRDFATKIIARVSEQVLECNPIDKDRDGTIDMTITYVGSDGVAGTLSASSYSVLGNRVRFATPLTVLGNYNISFFCVRSL